MSENTLKMIKDSEASWVDLRFTDTKGKEQHVSIPSSEVDEGFFVDGKMFDGSSIAGWKGINESDMILMPDDATAVLDPFTDETTVILRCSVVEPLTGQGYERDPRSVAMRAEEHLKSTGIADSVLFGPEPEFFVFDDVKWHAEMSSAGYEINSEEAAWSNKKSFEDGNTGHRPDVKGGYFPVPPVDSLHDIRAAMCGAMADMVWKLKYITTKWAPPANVKLVLAPIRSPRKRMKFKFLNIAPIMLPMPTAKRQRLCLSHW